ncbi:hypothetical protein AB0C51_08120 [Streptomyces pathocidini]|uniref:Integral membrane protein n=1 Tax=Streptomyces pathocidini TaxID=1650571 RepID=A0ABW7UQI5_9ACTN|nr:hypothetical protein [Streptomyces pathocidini]
MIWEALGSMVLGLTVAYAAARWLPGRLPARPLVLVTGAVAALFGALITYTVIGAGHPLATLLGGLAVGAALLSLLVRPAGGRQVRRSPAV